MNLKKIVWLKLRLVMGLIFLWSFVDKLFGLGFATKSENAWINGGSPTSGFLMNSTRGPLEEFFKGLAGLPLVDWLFMLGLLFVGLVFLFNRFVVWGALAGSMMVFLMWIAVFPPTNNPLLDQHIVYILVFALLALKNRER
jgi:thiosulfate dehydrogenase [quinone] large subunit